jgi:hypothetical protein
VKPETNGKQKAAAFAELPPSSDFRLRLTSAFAGGFGGTGRRDQSARQGKLKGEIPET